MKTGYHGNPAFNGRKGPECAYYCQNVLKQDIQQRGGPRRRGGLPVEHYSSWACVADRLREEANRIVERWEQEEPDWRQLMSGYRPDGLTNAQRRQLRLAERERCERKIRRFLKLYRRPMYCKDWIGLWDMAKKMTQRWGKSHDNVSERTQNIAAQLSIEFWRR